MLSFEVILRLVLSTGVVVGGVLAIRWWSTRAAARSRGAIRVVARAGISRSSSVAVIDVGEQRFLVGAGEHSVSLLAVLDQHDDLDGGDPATVPPGSGTDPAGARRERFDAVLERMSTRAGSFEPAPQTIGTEGTVRTELERAGPRTGPLGHLRRWTTRVPREVRIHGVDG